MGLVNCTRCGKKYFKDNRHINENLKLGQNFYCSSLCLSLFRTKKIKCQCNNQTCKKDFFRIPAEIGSNNYCSKSCAAIVNNQIRKGIIRNTQLTKISPYFKRLNKIRNSSSD